MNGVDHLQQQQQQQHHHSQNYSHLQQRKKQKSIFKLSIDRLFFFVVFIAIYSPSTPGNHNQQSISPPRFTLHHTSQSQSDYRHSSYDETNRYVAGTSTRRTSTSPNTTVYDNGVNQGWTQNEAQHYYGLPTAYPSAANLNDVSFLQQTPMSNNTDQIQFWNDNPAVSSYIQCIGKFYLRFFIFEINESFFLFIFRWLL